MKKETRRITQHHNIRVSLAAYEYLREKSKEDEFHGRGIVGVVDKLVLGEFSTIGAGRIDSVRANERAERQKKSAKRHKKPLTKCVPFDIIDMW